MLRRPIVSGTTSVVEVAGVETTVSFDVLNTHTSVSAAVFSVDLSAATLGAGGEFTFTVDGSQVDATSSFETTFIYSGTTLELSFSSRQTAFHFTGEGSTEVTIPSIHSHLTVDGIETAVDIPGFTTTIVLTGSSDIIVDVPATTTQMTIPEATYVFSAITTTLTKDGSNSYFCDGQPVEAGGDNSPCVVGTTFTFDVSGAILYLHDQGTTEVFNIPGITTTLVPEQTITIVKDGSTEASVIPAVVSSHVTPISDTNVSSEESSASMEPTITGPVTITVTEPGTTEPGTTEHGIINDSTTIPGTTVGNIEG